MKHIIHAVLMALALAASALAVDTSTGVPKGMDPATAEKMRVATTPNQGHKVLDTLAGSWKYELEYWPAPGATPEKSTGSLRSSWILDGRFLEQRVKGTAMGAPYNGLGTMGYNTVLKRYESTWIDNMSTSMMRSTAQYDPATKTFAEKSVMTDHMTGKEVPSRGETKIKDNDHYTSEMYATTPDGKEFLSMRLSFTRKK